MGLVQLIAEADGRSLAASGLACLDRCRPLLDEEPDVLRPLWAGIAEGEESWAGRLAAVRTALEAAPADEASSEDWAPVRKMIAAAPSEWAAGPLGEWAAACSGLALELHRELDPVRGPRGPLAAGEERRQVQILELLAANPDGAALRRALDLSTEGRRVLRAALSRRARGGADPS
ncbi:hypothetical protein DDQ41_21540 [Streptomyces spongiicola]|uniref:Uncharacterized protein n=1 Tax=Streptomyces spongiicola TaxID=1690221 RepID=A0ABM6VA67_9ACTN|nr:hypothetical protein [Streptomyces spongiicola]AWK11064.1 hypothetical protein DDQ41_21540 [Streptomyces spongiicola]